MPLGELNRIDDPRDALQKAKRIELAAFARERGVAEIDPRMPAQLMRKILRDKGVTDIRLPDRRLGLPGNPGYNKSDTTPEYMGGDASAAPVTAEDLLMQQWQRDQAVPPMEPEAPIAAAPSPPASPLPSPLTNMAMPQLRKRAKEQGIKAPFSIKKSELIQMMEQANAENASGSG